MRIISHPIFRDKWEIRVPCPYSKGETVVFIGTLWECIKFERENK
jgi:hypothetical protein